jgi:uncharacterized protein
VRRQIVLVIVLAACRGHDQPAPHPGAGSAGSGAPTIGLLRTPSGTVQASPEQTVATLRDNCDRATRDNNLAVACFSLGQLYDTGTFVARDGKLAMGLHEKSCGLGEMRACAELGAFYDDGVVVPREVATAKKYFRMACDGGNGRGCNSLVLLHPEAATKDEIAYVIERYRAICDGGGDVEACMALGDVYRKGEWLPVDAKRAIELYDRACTANHPMACNNLGAMYVLGQGTKVDPEKAAALYAKACSIGSREGCINAGIDPATAPVQIKK